MSNKSLKYEYKWLFLSQFDGFLGVVKGRRSGLVGVLLSSVHPPPLGPGFNQDKSEHGGDRTGSTF